MVWLLRLRHALLSLSLCLRQGKNRLMHITHRLLSHHPRHLRLLLRRLLKTFLKSKIKEHSSLTAQVGLGVLEAMAEI